ncbi:MAG TPA: FAD-binding protein [Oscillospiraceae bacterium]|nr:FAD-binding protein [Oscillospiraceae bacterium]
MSHPKMKELRAAILTALLLFSLLLVLLVRFSWKNEIPDYPPLPYSVDVVVVGSGLAGELTAIAAAQQDTDVLYLNLQQTEQQIVPPYVPTFWFAARSPGLTAEAEPAYLPETMALEIYTRGKEAGNYAQILNFCLQSAASLQWLESLTGLDLVNEAKTNQVFHKLTARQLSELCQETAARLPKLVRAEKDWLPLRLKQQGNRVKGLVVRTAEGQELDISARAVVLADGGFASNQELLLDYAGLKGTRPRLEGGHQGVGLQLAQALGGITQNMSQVWLQPVIVQDGARIEQLIWQEALLFNAAGQVLTGDNLTKILLRANGTVFVVAGAGNAVAQQIKTQTIDDVNLLAAVLNSEPAAVAEQVKQLKAPYQVAVLGLVALTPGGLTVSEDYAVMGQQGALEGLYAAGELTTGLHGRQAIPELFLTEAVVSAKIAGEQAAQWAKR